MIEMAFIIAFVVLFIHVCTWEGMIFGFVSEKLKSLPNFIKKPLFDCPICMTPYYGSIIILSSHFFGTHVLPSANDWVLIVLMAGGINTFLIYIISVAKAISKEMKEYDCNCTKKESPEEKSLKREKRLESFIKNQSS